MSKEKQIEEMACKKCLHYEMCLDNFRKAKEEGLWELTDEEEYFSHADECDFCAVGYRKQSKWISVEDRLPEPHDNVLTYDKVEFLQTNYLTLDGVWAQGVLVTHWMPLPEAPKGGAE